MVNNKKTIFSLIIFAMCFTLLPAQHRQKGKASYYSKKATGARTSSGERLHHDSLTCAHRTHPFGTKLKVTNPANGKMVFVKVTDRGPFGRNRIIDLSWRAAKELDMLSKGVAMVLVEPMDTTIIPFKPNESIEMPDFGFESAGIIDDVRPEWYEMKEINHKPATAHPKNHTAVKTRPTTENQKTHHTTKGKTETNHQNNTDMTLDEISNKPNTSRSYSKRQRGK